MASGPFIGRDGELVALRHAYQGGLSLVTITGMGGCGKSRLAEQFALSYAGPTWFVDASQIDDADIASVAVAEAVGEGRLQHLEDLPQVLAAAGPGLVVVDAFEKLAGRSAETLGAWRAAAPELRFLVTSRMPLGLTGEQVVLLEPLPAGDAMELLVARARMADFRFDPSSAIPALDDIVARLEGIPLAIELAAARLQTLSVDQLRARLQQGIGVLRAERRDHPEHQVAMEAVLDASWALLSEREQAALVQCAVFRQPFTVEAAEAVLALPDASGPSSTLDVVQSLHAHGLLRSVRGGATPRLALLDVVRDYVSRHGTPDAVLLARHTACFRERVARWASASGFLAHALDGTDALDEIEVEDLVAIVRRDAACPEARTDAAVAVSAVLYQRGPAQRLWQVLAEAMAAVGEHPLQAARLTLAAHRSLQYFGLRVPGFLPFEEAISAAEGAGEWSLAAQLLVYAAAVAQLSGDPDVARLRCERAFELGAAADDVVTPLLCEQARVAVELYTSPMDRCVMRCRDMVASAEDHGLPYLKCRWLDNYGGVLFEAGYVQEASDVLREAQHLRSTLADPYPFGNIAGNQLECAIALGREDEARQMLALAAEIPEAANPGFALARARVEVLNALAEGRLADAEARLDAPEAWQGASFMVQFRGVQEYLRGLSWMHKEAYGPAADCFAVAAGWWEPHAQWMMLDYAVLRAVHACALAELGDVELSRLYLAEAASLAERWQCARFARCVALLAPWVEGGAWAPLSMPPRDEGPQYLECQIVERALALRVARTPVGPVITVGPELGWVQIADQPRISFRRGQLARRLLGALVEAHDSSPGVPLPSKALLDAGWPGDRSKPEALDNRLWVALSRIRSMGLHSMLERVEGGYRLAPSVQVVRA